MNTYGSVCSGIEAASLAWEPLGFVPAWFSEIESFPSAVLNHHWPHVPNLGDMTKIAAGVRSGDVAAPAMLVGGTPCQAFSVAGLRGGLSDPRGQLSLSYVDLANAIDEQRIAAGLPETTVVWENVPGVLSSKDNAFGCFLAGLAGESCELQPAGGKWTNAGYVLGPQRAIAWIVKDAQYFGVAQRRRRVFVVASARKGFDPREVLFESEGMRRDTPPSREARSITSALTANGVGTCGADDNQAQAGHLVPYCMAHGQAGAEIQENLATTLTCNHEAPIAFSSNGYGSFSSGTGPLRAKSGADHENLAVAFNWQAGGNTSATLGADEHVTGALQCNQTPAVCVTGDITHTLRAEGHDASEDGTADAITGVAFGEESDGGNNSSDSLTPWETQGNRIHGSDGVSSTLSANPNGGTRIEPIFSDIAVRRLTPRECERLQGMPDDHTLIPYGKTIRPEKLADDYAKYLMRGGRVKTFAECCTAAADGPRYKAIGNSMAVPCMSWIGRRIIYVTEWLLDE